MRLIVEYNEKYNCFKLYPAKNPTNVIAFLSNKKDVYKFIENSKFEKITLKNFIRGDKK